jgi:hypothetical protein
MLKTLLRKSIGSEHRVTLPPGNVPLGGIDLDALKTLIEFYAIGKKLRYYPEFKRDVVFDTFVVGYAVNGYLIYSGEAIDRDSQGYPAMFRFGEDEDLAAAPGLKSFQLLVPDTSNLEMKLDYHRRALIGRGQQFKRGKYITLVSRMGRGVATVDTVVAKPIVLTDGPYAHAKMVLLTPELDTLELTDQRGNPRTKICVPVMVSAGKQAYSGPCTLVDMTDGTVRIRVLERDAKMPELRRGNDVILDINLKEIERHYTIKGRVVRSSPGTCVIRLEELVRDGLTEKFDPLDILHLKAGLLNYGHNGLPPV